MILFMARIFLRERLSSAARLTIVLVLVLFRLVLAYRGMDRPSDSGFCLFYVWILGAGVIGADVSSGVLHMLFTRPLRRSTYVIGRWIGLVIGALVVYEAQVLIGLAAALAGGKDLAVLSIGPDLAAAVVTIVGASAAIVFLSSLISGYGDIRIVLLLWVTSGMLVMLQAEGILPIACAISRDCLVAFLQPKLDFPMIWSGRPFGWLDAVPFVTVVVSSLVLAVFMMNRKEISYSSS